MANLYYHSLYNEQKATAMQFVSKGSLEPFSDYLQLAVNSLENRRVSAFWRPYEIGQLIHLVPQTTCLEIESQNTVEVVLEDEWYWVRGVTKKKDNVPILFPNGASQVLMPNDSNFVDFHGELYVRPGFEINEQASIFWGDAKIILEPLQRINSLMQNGNPIEIGGWRRENSSFVVEYKGIVDFEIPVQLNGIPARIIAEQKEENREFYLNAEQKLQIVGREGNAYHIMGSIDNGVELYYNGQPIQYRIKRNPTPEMLTIENGQYVSIEKDGGRYRIDKFPELCDGMQAVDKDNANIIYKIQFAKEKDDGAVWVRLIDDDSNCDEDGGFSKLDYFFEDVVDELEESPRVPMDRRRRFNIVKGDRDEYKLLLKSTEYKKRITYEDLPDELFIPVNTYVLRMQHQALRTLTQRPLLEQGKLLKLVEKRSGNLWQTSAPVDVSKWYVLTDESRDGTNTQREFCKRAMATEDFMLLEGPPGSGKTTAIMELILQLIKKGNRILLTASTHVAIDNVIERLLEKNLMDGVLPLRIGKESNIPQEVMPFLESRIAPVSNPYRDLIIDAANLVCGTTIGILKHPHIRRVTEKKDDDDTRPVPEFDYMIIDESSKTTFQEFLVPAMYAKKWILVGDVKQLSPFTDEEYLIANLRSFGEQGNNVFDGNAQRANLIIANYLCGRNSRSKPSKVCIIESEAVIDSIRRELMERKLAGRIEQSKVVVFYTGNARQELNDMNIYDISANDFSKKNPKRWLLMAAEAIFTTRSDFESIRKYVPNDMLVLNGDSIDLTDREYREWKYNSEARGLFERENRQLRDKEWAKELYWMTSRVFQLRDVPGKGDNYSRKIENLMPQLASTQVRQKYETIKDFALPSILQSLKEGVGSKSEEQSHVLNSGFLPRDLNSRYVCLDYQHRMHPDISVFSRKRYYSGKDALKDAKSIDRRWTYNRYPTRNVWIDVKGSIEKNRNEKEAQTMWNELSAFLRWARENPKSRVTGTAKEIWSVACLTFHKGQEKLIRNKLQSLKGCENKMSQFHAENVKILLYTVDRFQGREADITFISMVKTDPYRIGFLDNPNRLNVAVTRARYQRVIIGSRNCYQQTRNSEDLNELARQEVEFAGLEDGE